MVELKSSLRGGFKLRNGMQNNTKADVLGKRAEEKGFSPSPPHSNSPLLFCSSAFPVLLGVRDGKVAELMKVVAIKGRFGEYPFNTLLVALM